MYTKLQNFMPILNSLMQTLKNAPKNYANFSYSRSDTIFQGFCSKLFMSNFFIKTGINKI
jgi:hypothetical protein